MVVAVAGIGLVVQTIAVVAGGNDPASTPRGVVTEDPVVLATAGPSQSRAEAERDGVIGEVADLPLADRFRPLDHSTGADRIVAPEGTWVISTRAIRRTGPGPCLGDQSGRYGLNYVCGPEYGEILLLDGSGHIVRAYPFPSYTPHELALGADALYCARQGDGGLPSSMLCRIDRRSLAATVRVFPHGDLDPVERSRVPGYPWWTVGEVVRAGRVGDVPYALDPSGAPPFSRLVVTGGAVRTGGAGGLTFDPRTLEPLPSASATTTPVRLATCSASGMEPAAIPLGGVPAAVAEARAKVIAAAVSCDFVAMTALMSPTFTWSFGGDRLRGQAVDAWMADERNGGSTLRLLVTMLNLGYGSGESEGRSYYTWPSAFGSDWNDVPESERLVLESIYGSSAPGPDGSYIGVRAGFTEDGAFVFFVGGD